MEDSRLQWVLSYVCVLCVIVASVAASPEQDDDTEKRAQFMLGKRDDDKRAKFMLGKRDQEEDKRARFMFGKRDQEEDKRARFMFGKRDQEEDKRARFMFGKRDQEEDKRARFMFGKRDQEEDKRARFMFGKRDQDQELTSADEDSADKRAFGWGTYHWSPVYSPDAAGPASTRGKRPFGNLFNGRQNRRFLLGKREDDDEDVEKRRRIFSFGRRSDVDAFPDSNADLYDPYTKALFSNSLGVAADGDDVSKRGRMVMLGKRPFGLGSHHWSVGDDNGVPGNKRLFKFGKRADENVDA